MDLLLTDKTVLITGASGGIGRALARAFGAEGCNLVLTGHSQFGSLQAWVREQAFADRALACSADITDLAQVRAAVNAGRQRFGRVDICVANAGKWPPPNERLDEMPPQRFEDTLRVNLLGSVWTAKAFMEALAATGPRADGHGAALTFIGSTAGKFGEPGHADYATSKAGLYGLVRTLKTDIARIDPFGRVNMVEPGWTVTEMARPALEQEGVIQRIVRTMPMRQLARADDIARTVLVLSSPAISRHTSGEVMTVAGGMDGRTLWGEQDIDEEAIRRRVKGT
ncbi:MAG: SDR family oxidoreductase [Planctomycetes bacterium]|nr:SDR family oxidoreductase [Planctomycetota bacterium]